MEIATLGGGCFWCLHAVFSEIAGVERVRSGYAGGQLPHPDYEAVCRGDTWHAEVVEISFDPAQVSYRQLLEVFFAIHDPTTLNRQGADVGTQYRSVIFTHSAEQAGTANAIIAEIAQELPASVVTQILPAPEFFAAEDYHQDYFRRQPDQGYCAFVIAPKLDKFRKKFASLRAVQTIAQNTRRPV